MDLLDHFRMLARYNRLANEALCEPCSRLDDAEYRKRRPGSFGSIHALLNHMLLADRIWMARFEGDGSTTPPLDTILYDSFPELHSTRAAEDARIEQFFAAAEPAFLEGSLRYINSRGQESTSRIAISVPHFFNHQTHHRGQVHVMLSQTPVPPPSLDLHRLIHFA